MGKKGGWFSKVKRVWRSDSKKKDKAKKGANLGSDHNAELDSENHLLSSMEAEEEQSRHAYSVAFATAVAAEAAVAAAQAAAEVVRLKKATRKPKEEIAAIRIQSAFRGYMVRREIRLVKLRTMIGARSGRRQAITTLKCMQTIARLQAEVRARRIRMSEENSALQKQLHKRREKELKKPENNEENFDVSGRSKDQIKAKVESRNEAAKRRERALAYAYTHQRTRRNTLKSANNEITMDLYNPQWSWSWLDKWMATRPWEEKDKNAPDKEHNNEANNNNNPVKITPKTNPKSAGKLPKQSSSNGRNADVHDNDDDPRNRFNRNRFSVLSEHRRRHSSAETIVREYEKVGGHSRTRSFMAPTESTKARSRVASPTTSGSEKKHAKKRASRRHSAPS